MGARLHAALALALLAATLALPSRSAVAAGFAVASQGAAAMGIGGSATARLDLPELGYYNPAAWALLDGFQGSAGLTLLQPSVTHHDLDDLTTSADTPLSTPPYLNLGYGLLTDVGTFGFGLSGGVPFGSTISWPTTDDWAGRFELTHIGLSCYELGGTVAFAPAGVDGLAFAAGLRLVGATVLLEKQVDGVAAEGSVSLGGNTTGIGGHAAIAYAPQGELFDGLMLGITYRSRVDLAFSGNAHFDGVPIELSPVLHDGAVSTAITLPDRLAFGGAYDYGPGTFSLDIEINLWSTVQELEIDFTDQDSPDSTIPRRWHDAVAARAGYEHRDLLIDNLAGRLGLVFDQSPSPRDTLSPSSPDADRVLLTLGLGYALFDWGVAVDVSYAHVFFLDAEVTGDVAFPGSYEAAADLFALGLAYRQPSE